MGREWCESEETRGQVGRGFGARDILQSHQCSMTMIILIKKFFFWSGQSWVRGKRFFTYLSNLNKDPKHSDQSFEFGRTSINEFMEYLSEELFNRVG